MQRIEEESSAPTLLELSELAGLSVRHLTRAFAERTGSSVHAFIECRRFDRAARSLRETDIPVAEISRQLAADLARMAKATGGSLAVTPSRRTGADNEQALRDGFRDTRAYIWDKEGDNPYFGLLALADVIVVTEDSVSMTSEAIATGKPVYVAPLAGESRRIRRFHQDLIDDGITRRFDGTFATWRYDPPDDTARAAAIIRQRLSWGEAPHGA